MKTITTQSGKSFAGFIVGLLLATAVIVGVLFFLNKNTTTFKQPTVDNTPPKPEILTPANSASNIPSDNGGEAIGASAASTENTQNNTAPAPTESPETPTEPTEAPTEHKTPAKPAHSVKKTEKQTAPAEKKNKTAPSEAIQPEDILNSGSLEKAEQKAKQRAKKAATESGHKVMLQIGSYNDHNSADTQRAKLAMLGVNAQINKTTVNGKTVYRVQTPALARNQAEQLSNKLKQNNIDSLMRTAP